MSSNKQDQIDQIFTRMSQSQREISAVDLDDEQYLDGYASWYRNDTALMAICRAGTFSNHETVIIKYQIGEPCLNLNSMLRAISRVS